MFGTTEEGRHRDPNAMQVHTTFIHIVPTFSTRCRTNCQYLFVYQQVAAGLNSSENIVSRSHSTPTDISV